MSTLTIELEDDLLDISRKYAREDGTTVEAVVREFLADRARRRDSLEAMFAYADATGMRSVGGYLTREEIYDRG